MHTTLYDEYLAALTRRARERVDHATACLPFLVDPLFRKRDDGARDNPTPTPPGTQSLSG